MLPVRCAAQRQTYGFYGYFFPLWQPQEPPQLLQELQLLPDGQPIHFAPLFFAL